MQSKLEVMKAFLFPLIHSEYKKKAFFWVALTSLYSWVALGEYDQTRFFQDESFHLQYYLCLITFNGNNTHNHSHFKCWIWNKNSDLKVCVFSALIVKRTQGQPAKIYTSVLYTVTVCHLHCTSFFCQGAGKYARDMTVIAYS